LDRGDLFADAERVIREREEDLSEAQLATLEEAVPSAKRHSEDGADMMEHAYAALARATNDDLVLEAAEALYVGARLLLTRNEAAKD
jgi:hypothetical protein